MKHLFRNIILTMGVLSLLVFNACKDDISPIYDELQYDRVFAPIGLDAKIENQTTVKLNWTPSDRIKSYTLEISFDSLAFASDKIIYSETVSKEDLPVVFELPTGNARFSARVVAVSEGEATNSTPALITFKSLPENLFEGYKLTMEGLNAITLNWKPGKKITEIFFDDGTANPTPLKVAVTDEDIAAGKKVLTAVTNGIYNVKLMNGENVRGQQNYAMEGNVLLAPGEDLTAAISAASAGDVIVLTGGEKYPFVGDMTMDKSLKIKGLDGRDHPVLYITSGNKMFSIGSNLTPADSLVFEGLQLNGLTNISMSEGPHRGIFDQEKDICDLGAIKFIGCELYNVGRHVLRLRSDGGAKQTLGTLSFDKCIIRNVGGQNASFGVLSVSKEEALVKNIQMTNSTVDSLKSHFMRYDKSVGCESITLENCTFNRAPFAAGRYFLDLKSTTFTTTGNGLTINKCIFGNTTYATDGAVSGIRIVETAAYNVKNSYSTSDFSVDTDAIKGLSPIEMPADALWNNPEEMDFTFKANAVEAGDPRWY